MELPPSTEDVLVRLPLAVLAGGLVGLEREWKRKPAGLRTHMMVCLGSATFTLVALQLYAAVLSSHPGGDATRLDPLRLIEGVVGGIGFLGAGTILQSRGSVRGLTTAGGLWLVGALGIAIGGGHLFTATLAMLLALTVLYAFRKLERLIAAESDSASASKGEDGE